MPIANSPPFVFFRIKALTVRGKSEAFVSKG